MQLAHYNASTDAYTVKSTAALRYGVRPPLSAAYAAASASCPLACRAREAVNRRSAS